MNVLTVRLYRGRRGRRGRSERLYVLRTDVALFRLLYSAVRSSEGSMIHVKENVNGIIACPSRSNIKLVSYLKI